MSIKRSESKSKQDAKDSKSPQASSATTPRTAVKSSEQPSVKTKSQRGGEPELSVPELFDSSNGEQESFPANAQGNAGSSPRAPRTASNMSNQAGGHGERQGFGGTAKAKRRVPRARRMSLSLTHVDPWSVAKVAFLLSVAAGIIQIVAVGLIWALLNVVGVFDQVTQLVSSAGLDAGGFNLSSIFSLGTVLSTVTILSIVEVILATLLAVIIAALYNVVSQLVGGMHVTLGDD